MLKITLKESVTDIALPKLNEFRFSLSGSETGAISFSTKTEQDPIVLEVISGNAKFYTDESATQLVGTTFKSSELNNTVYVKFDGDCIVSLSDYTNLTKLGTASAKPFYKGGVNSFVLDLNELKYINTLTNIIAFDLRASYGDVASLSKNPLAIVNFGNNTLFTGSLKTMLLNSKSTLSDFNVRGTGIEVDLDSLKEFSLLTAVNCPLNTFGDLNSLPSLMKNIFINGNVKSLTYTGTSGKWQKLERLSIDTYSLPSAQFKNLVIHCATLPWAGGYKELILKGTIGSDTEIQNAIATMQAKGVTVTIKA